MTIRGSGVDWPMSELGKGIEGSLCTHRRLQADLTAAKQAPIIPTARTIRDIYTLGLSLIMIKFEGRSNRTYAT